MIHNINKQGYILDRKGQIEQIKYRDYLREFGSDETTTPRGVAPRLYVDGNTIMTWGVRGNNHAFYGSFKNNREAVKTLFKIWENYIEEKNWDAPRFYSTKKELFEDLADRHEKNVKVVKRYFRLQDFKKSEALQTRKNYENRLNFSPEKIAEARKSIVRFINSNREMVLSSLVELDELKTSENKADWQVKANALIQKVSNNDFRVLKWKEIYNLIRETAKV